MATPQPRSFQAILGDMIDALLARKGISDLRPGSAILSLLEAAAQSDFRASQDIFAILDTFSIDRATGESLDRLGADNNVNRLTAIAATGNVDFTDRGFNKIVTQIYPGVAAPNGGATELYVTDASGFPANGRIYVGRGTGNFEGPLTYSAKTAVGAYWRLTLSTPTTKFHNLSESVILAQGGARLIFAGTVVQTPQGNASQSVQFQTNLAVVIPDGEVTVSGVQVVALTPGSVGNVPRGAVVSITASLHENLSVSNRLPFVTGQDQESDADYRARIKRAVQARTRGTAYAIESSVVGATTIDEPKRISASRVIEQPGWPTRLIVDDGSGYEELTSGVGFVSLVDRAIGGEMYLQLPDRALAKAYAVSTLTAPFRLADLDTLAVMVGTKRTEHEFRALEFTNIANATAFEVVSSINSDPNMGFSATTADGGTRVRLVAKVEDDEGIQVVDPLTGDNANGSLGFVDYPVFTLDLYKNDVWMSKDGRIATLNTDIQASWGVISHGDTLTLNVDNTGPVGYTINDADFVVNNTGYSTVSPANSLEAWAIVFNAKLPGVSTAVSGSRLVLTSNLGPDDRASLVITGGTLVTKGMFTLGIGLSTSGVTSQYRLNRNTGQISLIDHLVEGDNITAGSRYTRAYIQGDDIGGSVTLTSDAHLWVVMDGDSTIAPMSIDDNDVVDVTNPGAGDIWRYTFTTSNLSLEPGDWIVVWDPSISDANNRGYWRVSDAAAAWFEVERGSGTVGNYTLGAAGNRPGIVGVRTEAPVQELVVGAGLSILLPTVVAELNSQLRGGAFTVISGARLRLTSLTYSHLVSEVRVVTSDLQGRELGLDDHDFGDGQASHIAFSESQNPDFGTPVLTTTTVAVSDGLEPPLNLTTTDDLSVLNGVTPNHLVGFLGQLDSDRMGSNRFNYTQLEDIVGADLTLRSNTSLRESLVDDRVFLASPYDFGADDSLIVELDRDPVNKTFVVPMFRNVAVAGLPVPPGADRFYVYDTDQGLTDPLSDVFGDSFDFSDFKLWMRARTVVDPTNDKNAIIYRSAHYGPDGNRCQIAYVYPALPDTAWDSIVTVGENTNIEIVIPSGPETVTGADGTTQFDITEPVANTWRYTYDGTGTNPDFVGSWVVADDIVTFGPASAFAANNQGTFRITAVGANYIDVYKTAGTVENNKILNVGTAMVIYPLDTTATAGDLLTYVDTDLSDYISATLTDDDPVGTPNDGSGLIQTSTQDDFAVDFISLEDGENWVLSSDLTGVSETLVLKRTLGFVDPLYTVVGEVARLVPTTADQLSRFMNVLGTSGVVSMSGVSTASRNRKLQISSTVLGSSGSVHVTGGTANTTSAAVIGTGSTVDVVFTKTRINTNVRRGFHANQWVRITSGVSQPKALGFNGTTTAIDVTSGAANQIDITAGPGSFQTPRVHTGDGTTEYRLEKLGPFWSLSWTGTGTDPDFGAAGVQEGDWMTLGATFAAINQGTFRVIRLLSPTQVCFENLWGVEEIVIAGAAEPEFVSYDSVLVGDWLRISGNVLGANNAGTYLVTAVNSNTQIEVDGTMVTVGPIVLGGAYTQVQILEREPFEAIKQIYSVATDPSVSDQTDIILYGIILNNKIAAGAQGRIVALNKLGFFTDLQIGADGYKRYRGLIDEAYRIVYGDPLNPSSYPGVKAAGAQLNIEGPIIKRIQVSLSVRARTGVPFSIIQEQVINTVASTINLVPLGTPVAISSIIAAAGEIDGVIAVSVIAPVFDSENDLIEVQAFEKPMVINPAVDVLVIEVGA